MLNTTHFIELITLCIVEVAIVILLCVSIRHMSNMSYVIQGYKQRRIVSSFKSPAAPAVASTTQWLKEYTQSCFLEPIKEIFSQIIEEKTKTELIKEFFHGAFLVILECIRLFGVFLWMIYQTGLYLRDSFVFTDPVIEEETISLKSEVVDKENRNSTDENSSVKKSSEDNDNSTSTTSTTVISVENNYNNSTTDEDFDISASKTTQDWHHENGDIEDEFDQDWNVVVPEYTMQDDAEDEYRSDAENDSPMNSKALDDYEKKYFESSRPLSSRVLSSPALSRPALSSPALSNYTRLSTASRSLAMS